MLFNIATEIYATCILPNHSHRTIDKLFNDCDDHWTQLKQKDFFYVSVIKGKFNQSFLVFLSVQCAVKKLSF